jgi:glycosyltransferase involved in cell wall biosynthesis
LRALVVTTHLIPAQLAVWEAASQQVDVQLAGTLSSGETGGRRSPATVPTFAETHVFAPRDLTRRGPVWWTYPGLEALIRRLQPDLVHVHSEPWALLSRQALRARRPTVLHGADNMFDHGGRLEARARLVMARANRRRAAGYASWNQRGLDLARAHGLPSSSPTAVVPAGVSWPPAVSATDRAQLRRQWGLSGCLVGYVGRLIPLKGVSVLIDAMASARAAEATLVVIGDGPERQSLESRARHLGVPARFLGALPEQEAARALSAMDVAVTPSLTTAVGMEQYGRSVVEAMSVGTPVVVSDSGALPEVVGPAGVVVPEGRARELAEALERLLGDEGLRRQLSRLGLERFATEHRPDVVGERLVALWRTALDARGRLSA